MCRIQKKIYCATDDGISFRATGQHPEGTHRIHLRFLRQLTRWEASLLSKKRGRNQLVPTSPQEVPIDRCPGVGGYLQMKGESGVGGYLQMKGGAEALEHQ
jgi:hypothetical protein